MRKTDKKLDQAVCTALTDVCHWAQDTLPGFTWLTHTADFRKFPESLQVTCVFTRHRDTEHLQSGDQHAQLLRQTQQHLQRAGIYLRDIHKHVRLDSEQACDAEHNGNWKRRLTQ